MTGRRRTTRSRLSPAHHSTRQRWSLLRRRLRRRIWFGPELCRFDDDLRGVVLAGIGRQPRKIRNGRGQAVHRRPAATLAVCARQNGDVMEDQLGRDRKWRPRRRVPIGNVHRKAGDNVDRAGAILNGLLAVEIAGLRSVWANTDNADAAADADRGCGGADRDRPLMAELTADILQLACSVPCVSLVSMWPLPEAGSSSSPVWRQSCC